MKSSTAHLHTDKRFYILVAHKAGAHLFSKGKGNASCKWIESFDHPAGRLKDQEIDADRPGRTNDRFGGAKHAYMRRVNPSSQKAKEFAKSLVQKLEKAFTRGDFDQLILVAPASFLGLMNSGMSKRLQEACDATFSKDFAELKVSDVEKRVAALLASLFPLYKDMNLNQRIQ